MIKTKLFSCSYVLTGNMGFKGLDERINDWFKENPNAEFVNIAYNSMFNSGTNESKYSSIPHEVHSALLIYKEV